MYIISKILSTVKNFQFNIIQPKHDFKIFGKVKIVKAGLKLITYMFVVNALTHCAMRLGINIGKERIIKLHLIFFLFISIGNMLQYGGVLYCPP